jgi:hypothetical protein
LTDASLGVPGVFASGDRLSRIPLCWTGSTAHTSRRLRAGAAKPLRAIAHVELAPYWPSGCGATEQRHAERPRNKIRSHILVVLLLGECSNAQAACYLRRCSCRAAGSSCRGSHRSRWPLLAHHRRPARLDLFPGGGVANAYGLYKGKVLETLSSGPTFGRST